MLLPEPNVSRALNLLCEQHDFVLILQWIERSKFAELENICGVQEPVRVHQMQGYALALADILRAARSANRTLAAHLG